MRRNFELARGTVIRTSSFDEWLRSTQSRRGKIGYRAFETDLYDGWWFWMTEAVQKNGWMLCIASDNRRFVMGRVDDMLAAPEHGSNGCLAVFDIDNFKHINDRLGHHAGDLVLRDFAHRIHQNVRRNDCFGRVGGEEFVLVMPATGPEDAIAMVERMLTVIRFSRPLPDSARLQLHVFCRHCRLCPLRQRFGPLSTRRSGTLCCQVKRPGQGARSVGA